MYAEKLKELGVTLPAAPGKGGLYAPTKTFGENKMMYVSGCGCSIPGEKKDAISRDSPRRGASNP